MHVFTESLGMPLRAYVLGLRVQRAVDALADGRSATEAAHIAGFSDAPHLTRTFRRTVGMTPREVIALMATRPSSNDGSRRVPSRVRQGEIQESRGRALFDNRNA
jgi:AraC-like DNA-binding protein